MGKEKSHRDNAKVLKIRQGMRFKDKKTGDLMTIGKRNYDKWNCIFDRSKRRIHGMHEFSILKFYEPI